MCLQAGNDFFVPGHYSSSDSNLFLLPSLSFPYVPIKQRRLDISLKIFTPFPVPTLPAHSYKDMRSILSARAYDDIPGRLLPGLHSFTCRDIHTEASMSDRGY